MNQNTQENYRNIDLDLDIGHGRHYTHEMIITRLDHVEDKVNSIILKIDQLTTAFTNNDLGKPDFDGHRKEHLTMAVTKKTFEGYKEDSAKKILGIAITIIGFLLLGGIIQWISSVAK